ncbi:MAG TPA: hypothetical protein VMM27_03210 [Casimicrobiaceae bacterium]|nr:hypothetical protein [Casimicrobiaceae bacterium]
MSVCCLDVWRNSGSRIDLTAMRESSNRTKVLTVLRKAPADAKKLMAATKLSKHEVAMAIEYLTRMNIVERLQ